MPAYSLRTVQQSLASRYIRCERAGSYHDGRQRYAVYAPSTDVIRQHTDDVEEAYIIGLKMASARDASNILPAPRMRHSLR